jgi:hypothetical protein
MQAVSLGLITVLTPGTPVRVSTNTMLHVAMMMVRTMPGFTGRTYLGLAGMNKSAASKPGVIRILSEPPAYGPQDGEVLPPNSQGQGNLLAPADFWVDADVANEGVLVTCFIA